MQEMQPAKRPKGPVFVQGSFMNRPVMRMFLDRGYSEAKQPEEAMFIVWTGGADINPAMYKQKPIPGTHFNSSLDLADVRVYSKCPHAMKIGICRGAQLLNVLNGGSLWQDVDGHNNGGLHNVIDAITGEEITVNTLHHQQLILPAHGTLVAYTDVSTHKDNYLCHWSLKNDGRKDLSDYDVEAAWFSGTNSLCYQPHPEFQHGSTREYFFKLIDRFYTPPH